MLPEANIGLVGHVSHGKTTLTEALTGKLTLTHSEELKRGITIRLGYADASFYKCKNGHYSNSEKCPICFTDCELLRTVSFIDAPGHETLMATVLTGASLMDGALLIVAANEKCPQSQTREHLAALEVVGIKNVVIVQTKIDLVTEERAKLNYQEIKKFVKGTILENSPVIPVSSQHRVNIDVLIKTIEQTMPTPKREEAKDLKMLVARSFDINKPGTEPQKLLGGVLGGAIIEGKLKLGDEIAVAPGIRVGTKYRHFVTHVTGLQKAGITLLEAGAGGLLGVMTQLDPALTKSDNFVGNIVGYVGKLPPSREELSLEVSMMNRSVNVDELKNIPPIKINEDLLLNVGTARSLGTVISQKKDNVELKLKIPISAEVGERVVISRLISGRWRLVGWGKVLA